jgi:hypothetical protein
MKTEEELKEAIDEKKTNRQRSSSFCFDHSSIKESIILRKAYSQLEQSVNQKDQQILQIKLENHFLKKIKLRKKKLKS